MRISVIIPTLNEASNLAECVQRVRAVAGNAEHEIEIIVADSGSSDDTPGIARELNCTLAISPTPIRCRAAALNLGAAKARGEVLLFLDADTLLPEDFAGHVLRTLEDARIVGGAFRLRFRERSFGLRLIEIINHLRYSVWSEYYGDQAVFARAADFQAVGGCPEVEILESAFLCRALRRVGRLRIAPAQVRTSARRFLDDGVARVFFHDVRIWLLDRLGVDVNRYGRDYWAYNARQT